MFSLIQCFLPKFGVKPIEKATVIKKKSNNNAKNRWESQTKFRDSADHGHKALSLSMCLML